ncbi:U6 snRNA phosphodiesterase [Fasciola gigantica]|uniref:U6 snRNA phosphodiesterase 1 n=1 Tax=Fasciola gigantica TaxID=46835 RepID=A0A504YDN9_FASGI|nr:U6 snRNA phosphodiesterase [Fasciola gigantica]
MSLVEYSSSEDESSEIHSDAKLELPAFLTTLSGDSLRFDAREDDPEYHQHRQRSFPHEIGNWSTSVFIPCPGLSEQLDELFANFCPNATVSLGRSLYVMGNPHLSLSKTWIVRHHWIEGLVASLSDALENVRRFDKLDVLVNEERTR